MRGCAPETAWLSGTRLCTCNGRLVADWWRRSEPKRRLIWQQRRVAPSDGPATVRAAIRSRSYSRWRPGQMPLVAPAPDQLALARTSPPLLDQTLDLAPLDPQPSARTATNADRA